MYLCPLCNGMKTIEKTCPSCQGQMSDQGRVIDFFDDYSPYMEDEGMKWLDGVADSARRHLCIHLFHCPQCDYDIQIAIQERKGKW